MRTFSFRSIIGLLDRGFHMLSIGMTIFNIVEIATCQRISEMITFLRLYQPLFGIRQG